LGICPDSGKGVVVFQDTKKHLESIELVTWPTASALIKNKKVTFAD
jgi:hypothetical protein